ncbi:MAG: hypothetical protein K1000chlam4_01104 [Chlamydiae bacterium]|nr:hypothetical protein [Chlamydiota bacterium]
MKTKLLVLSLLFISTSHVIAGRKTSKTTQSYFSESGQIKSVKPRNVDRSYLKNKNKRYTNMSTKHALDKIERDWK